MTGKKILIIIIVIVVVITLAKISKKYKQENLTMEEIIETLPKDNPDVVVEILEDGTQLNTSAKLNAEKEFDGLVITQSHLTNKDGVTRLLATVENRSNHEQEHKYIKVVFLNSNGKKIKEINGSIQKLKRGETAQLSVSITGNYVDIVDYEIEER